MATKVAWPNNVEQVAADVAGQGNEGLAAKILRGRSIARGTGAVLRGTGKAAIGVGRAATAVVDPVLSVGARGLGAVGDASLSAIKNNPRAAKYLGGSLLLAPILWDDAAGTYDRVTERILRARQDPQRLVEERDVMASLDEFLEKKAAAAPLPPNASRALKFMQAQTSRAAMDAVNKQREFIGADLKKGIASALRKQRELPTKLDFRQHFLIPGLGGLAEGTGKGIGEMLARGLGTALGGVREALFGNPAKKAILEKIMRDDRIIADAVQRNPAAKEQLLEAYATLNKFAPTLAEDINAVRSFLREVVLGGGQVNYATIKNLVDTEKALHPNSY